MEQCIEPLEKSLHMYFFVENHIWYIRIFMANIIWYSEIMELILEEEKNHFHVIQKL